MKVKSLDLLVKMKSASLVLEGYLFDDDAILHMPIDGKFQAIHGLYFLFYQIMNDLFYIQKIDDRRSVFIEHFVHWTQDLQIIPFMIKIAETRK